MTLLIPDDKSYFINNNRFFSFPLRNNGDAFNIKPNKFVCLIVFNATFNNISVISWRSVLLVEETGGPGENHRPVASH